MISLPSNVISAMRGSAGHSTDMRILLLVRGPLLVVFRLLMVSSRSPFIFTGVSEKLQAPLNIPDYGGELELRLHEEMKV